MLDKTEEAYFDSLCWEKINPIREKHQAELQKINPLTNPGNSPAPYTHEIRRFKKEIAEARIQAYIETYRKIARYPDESEFEEFANELSDIVDKKGDNLPRHFKGGLSPYPLQLVERIEEQLSNEIRRDAAIALSSLHHFINEGKLEALQKARQNQQTGSFKFSERFGEFQEYFRKPCKVLSDLDWNVIKDFIERIPSDLEKADFLKNLAKLPDDGVVNNIINDPPLHNRNQESLLRPLRQECSRLLSQHFNLENILRRVEQITDHGEALAYLWKVLLSYKQHHPGTMQGQYQSEELTFCKTIETEIQHRKDLQFSSLANRQTFMEKTEINLNNSSIGILNTGEMQDMQSISVNVLMLVESGHAEIAKALKELTEAVAMSSDLSADERAYVLEHLEELSRQAALSPSERAKASIIKSIAAGVGGTLSAVGGLAEVWSTWGPAIRIFFGF